MIAIQEDSIIIGKPNKELKPKFKYRINVQQKASKGKKTEAMKSFMIYDFQGRSNIDSVKKRLRGAFNGVEAKRNTRERNGVSEDESKSKKDKV